MIELKVYDNRDWVDLDVYGNENIALTFQVDDIRNLKDKNASYSKDFNLPATKKNNKFFEHFYDLDRYNLNFNPYKSVRVELYVDGILTLEGYMRLLSTLDKQSEISYKVVIFNDVANLIDSLGDDTIANLDISDIEHTFTQETVIASWYGINLGANNVDYTYSFNNTGNLFIDDGEITYVPHQNFVLNIKLKYIIDKIFQYAGFSYNSNFFNGNEFDRLYFDTTAVKDYGDEVEPYQIKSNTLNAANVYQVGGVDPSPGRPLFNGLQNAVAIPTTNTVGDNLGEYNQDTATFTAQNNCTLQVAVNLTYLVGIVQNVGVNMYINGVGVDSFTANEGSLLVGNLVLTTSTNAVLFGQINLLQGQSAQITFSVLINNPNLGGAVPFKHGVRASDYSIELAVTNGSSQDLVKTQLGDIKLADVIKDTFTMFNLIASDLGNKQINIEPYVSYISEDIVDWTRLIDYNEIELETVEIPRRLVFQHAEDKKDYYHNFYNEDNAISYGSHIINFDVDNRDEEIIKLNVFAAPFIKTIQGTDVTIQHMGKLNDDEIEPYKNKPRIVYRHTDLVNPIPATQYDFVPIDQFFAWETQDIQEFPQLTPFNNYITDAVSSDRSYMFGIINPNAISQNFTQPVNTLFSRFWRDYINEKYNVDTRIFKAKAKLSATDILNLDFSKKYKIKDQHYRLNKVDYNTDKNKLSSIELIRI